MKKSLLAIVLAAATMPLTFAAQAKGSKAEATNPPATTDTTAKRKVKKHNKKHHAKKGAAAVNATPANPSK